MTDLATIDNYFKMEMTAAEIAQFEERINTDPAFAEEVAFYVSTMHIVKEQSLAEKKQHFRAIYEAAKQQKQVTAHTPVRKLRQYMAAAAVTAGLVVGAYFYFKPASPIQLADNYISQHFVPAMGVKMDTQQDPLEAAMALYNDGKLPEALTTFEQLAASNNKADKPIRMAGIVSLRLANYNKALQYFTQLDNLTLQANPGKFYRALTLIKRNGADDKKAARQLLQQVIEKDLEEKETAQKWLQSF